MIQPSRKPSTAFCLIKPLCDDPYVSFTCFGKQIQWQMMYAYPVKHWLTTLLVGPVLMIGYEVFVSSHLMTEGLELFVLFGAFGFILSLPVFLIYLFVFNMMIARKSPDLEVKIALNTGGVILIVITFLLIIKGATAITLTLGYSFALVISSTFYRIGPRQVR